jgi:hypothetical protein
VLTARPDGLHGKEDWRGLPLWARRERAMQHDITLGPRRGDHIDLFRPRDAPKGGDTVMQGAHELPIPWHRHAHSHFSDVPSVPSAARLTAFASFRRSDAMWVNITPRLDAF